MWRLRMEIIFIICLWYFLMLIVGKRKIAVKLHWPTIGMVLKDSFPYMWYVMYNNTVCITAEHLKKITVILRHVIQFSYSAVNTNTHTS